MKTHRFNRKTKQRGFTLIELLMVLAIMSIVLTFAIPNFQNVISRSRLTTQANNIVEALNIARSNAISKQYQVGVAPISGTNWAAGYQVYLLKHTSNTTFDSTTDEILQTYADSAAAGFSIIPSTSFANKITYKPMGNIVETVTGNDKGFYVCSLSQADFRRVTVLGTGRIRAEKPVDVSYATACP